MHLSAAVPSASEISGRPHQPNMVAGAWRLRRPPPPPTARIDRRRRSIDRARVGADDTDGERPREAPSCNRCLYGRGVSRDAPAAVPADSHSRGGCGCGGR